MEPYSAKIEFVGRFISHTEARILAVLGGRIWGRRRWRACVRGPVLCVKGLFGKKSCNCIKKNLLKHDRVYMCIYVVLRLLMLCPLAYEYWLKVWVLYEYMCLMYFMCKNMWNSRMLARVRMLTHPWQVSREAGWLLREPAIRAVFPSDSHTRSLLRVSQLSLIGPI